MVSKEVQEFDKIFCMPNSSKYKPEIEDALFSLGYVNSWGISGTRLALVIFIDPKISIERAKADITTKLPHVPLDKIDIVQHKPLKLVPE